MPAKHVPWSEAERTTLREMWADGIGPVEIGRQTQHHRPSRANRAQPLPRGASSLPPLPSEASDHPT